MDKHPYPTGDERKIVKSVVEIRAIEYFSNHKSLKAVDWAEARAKINCETFGNYPISISLIKEVFWSLVHRGFIYIQKQKDDRASEGEGSNLGKVFKRHTSFNKKVKNLKLEGTLTSSR